MAHTSEKSSRSPLTAAAVNDPISRIEWRNAADLNANDYNPNVVYSPELRLLERSIILTGWVQPILITADGTIIDGFHRAMLARDSERIRARYGGLAPCAVLDVPRHKAMVLTIRMNRAKGSHVAIRMSAMVREMVEVLGMDRQEVAAEIGATAQEIDLLLQPSVLKAKDVSNAPYSRAWVPEETNRRGDP